MHWGILTPWHTPRRNWWDQRERQKPHRVLSAQDILLWLYKHKNSKSAWREKKKKKKIGFYSQFCPILFNLLAAPPVPAVRSITAPRFGFCSYWNISRSAAVTHPPEEERTLPSPRILLYLVILLAMSTDSGVSALKRTFPQPPTGGGANRHGRTCAGQPEPTWGGERWKGVPITGGNTPSNLPATKGRVAFVHQARLA